MAQALNTGSTLSFSGGQNRTSTAISTNIIIAVRNPLSGGGFTPVGAVQSMQISEKRGIKMIDEVGTDGHIDSVPNVSTNITGTCQRVRFDRLRITEAFSRGFIHVASQVYPFDIMIIDKQKRSSDLVITDTMTWEAETIFSTIAGGKPVAQGGELGVPHMGNLNGASAFGAPSLISGQGVTDIEQLVDTGAAGRRGSLDAAGLIDLADGVNLF